MKLNLRDIYILLECAKYQLRIINPNITIERENIINVVDKVINELATISVEVKDDPA